MKKIFLSILPILGLLFTNFKANAQWDILANIFGQMNTTDNQQFFSNLTTLDGTFSVNNLDNGNLLPNLYEGLQNPNFGGTLDGSYLDALDSGLGLLGGALPVSGLAAADRDTISGEFGRIDSLYNVNFDSLGGLFGQYQDSLVFTPGWTSWYLDGLNGSVNTQFNSLQDTFGMVSTATMAKGPGDVAPLIGQLFSQFSFPDLELAFGTQAGDFKYWTDGYEANAIVIRVGSVPRYDKVATKCDGFMGAYPVEARWHLEGSWVKGNFPTATSETLTTNGKQITPLIFAGDFAIMLTPKLGFLQGTSFRLITSLGMEFGTYAPAHRLSNPPATLANKGFSTGFGPQAGVGFAWSAGPIVVYSLNTIAHGITFNSPKGYDYDSIINEVGMRFGNIINVRYSKGTYSWQPSDNRMAKIRNQVTIGLILPGLHH